LVDVTGDVLILFIFSDLKQENYLIVGFHDCAFDC
jgi:hypothetical protein